MLEFLEKLFTSDFMPHGHCYYWRPEIVWTNAISDSIIALSYLCIPVSLVYIVKARKDFKFYWLLVLFALFILGCGATHIMDVINIWNPIYRLDSTIRVITALASIGTALMLIKITPRLLMIPDTEKFQKLNEELKNLNLQLEEKVQERTKQLQKNEEILRQRENQLRIITNSIPVFIAYIDKDLVFRYANDYYQNLQFVKGELIDQPLNNFFDHEAIERHRQFFSKTLKGEPVAFETDIKLKDGSLKHLNVNYIPDKDEEEKIRGFVALGVDMTDRIAYEKSLEEKNDLLMKTNIDLDNFIYTASHDLKAPISNMEGLLNNIYEDTKDKNSKEVSELLRMMKLSIERLKNTITELTEISQIQKEINLHKEHIYISNIIDEFKIDYQNQFKENKATIYSDLQVNEILFSRKNFRSIIYNLLSNAIKYRQEDIDPVIHIKTERVENNCILISIQDNGLGLNTNQKNKIFGMFKRLHTHVEGTGIGLYIVKRIIENAAGKIEVESELGKGSTFKVFLNQ